MYLHIPDHLDEAFIDFIAVTSGCLTDDALTDTEKELIAFFDTITGNKSCRSYATAKERQAAIDQLAAILTI